MVDICDSGEQNSATCIVCGVVGRDYTMFDLTANPLWGGVVCDSCYDDLSARCERCGEHTRRDIECQCKPSAEAEKA
jgi:hypothetical protein